MPEQLPIPDGEPVLYNKREAANYLRTTERHVERLVEQSALGHCRVGRFLRFTEADLQNYLHRTHVEPKGVK